MDEPLGQRQGSVLRSVVREYVRTGEPVGSKHLVGRYRLGVSSATVRNDMARLEELRYLVQPHTSAGRIPTDLGYRYFVDHLDRSVRLDERAERTVWEQLSEDLTSLDDLLARATEVLARITRHAAAVLAPRLTPARLRRIELVRMAPRKVMVVLIADSGRVEQHILSLGRDVADAILERLSADVNRDLAGLRLRDARARADALAQAASPTDRALLGGVADALGATLRSEDRLVVGGAANLADAGAFSPEALRDLYEALDRQKDLLEILASGLEGARSLTVRIGSENPIEELHECSVVVANYGLEGVPLGTVGIIGPTRMDYRRAIASAQSVADTMARTLQTFGT